VPELWRAARDRGRFEFTGALASSWQRQTLLIVVEVTFGLGTNRNTRAKPQPPVVTDPHERAYAKIRGRGMHNPRGVAATLLPDGALVDSKRS
jgi:hypothetical protein